MSARDLAERCRWRVWQMTTAVAAAALLAWGALRWGVLGGSASRLACPMTSRPDDLVPSDCWLVRGVLGLPAGGVDSTSPIWRVAAIAGVAILVAVLSAGSSPRRQYSLVICGLAWSIGLWVSVWAAEANARAESGLWWATRVIVWTPAAVATILVVLAQSQSPWRTLEPPGLRSARRRRLPGVDEVWMLPDISRVPAPVRLTWPVRVAELARG